MLIGVEADYGEGAENIFSVFEMFFIVIFALEVVIKIGGLGNLFFADSWNVLDLIIVIASVVEPIVAAASGGGGVNGLSALRLVRVLRVIRLVGMVERLATLVEVRSRGFSLRFRLGFSLLSVICLPGLRGGREAGNVGGDFGLDPPVYLCCAWPRTVRRRCGTEEQSKYAVYCPRGGACLSLVHSDYREEWFSTIPRTMITLFQIMSQDDWVPRTNTPPQLLASTGRPT